MALLESMNLPMGEEAKDFSLEGTDGKNYSLADFAEAKVLVIVFMCNHCPYVQAIWGRLNVLQEEFRDKGVQFVGINPNTGNSDYSEESMSKMQQYYEGYGMNFPYLEDVDQSVAKAYKAQCTPDIFVFDEGRKLAYHGRVDDSWRDESKVSRRELHEALESVLAGKVIEGQRPCMGCSIKWV